VIVLGIYIAARLIFQRWPNRRSSLSVGCM
jgi:hypothetical protein